MKKLICSVLLIALALSLSACDNGAFVDRTEYGLSFRLPEEFRKYNVNAYEISYRTADAKFQVQVMTEEEFEYIGMYFGMSVKEYTEELIKINEWGIEYKYDEARDVTSFYYFWYPTDEPTNEGITSNEELESKYYYMLVLKSNEAFYHVVMSCSTDDYEKYEQEFKSIGLDLSVSK